MAGPRSRGDLLTFFADWKGIICRTQLVSCVLILGLAGVVAVLLHLYSQANARRFDPELPSVAQLLATTRQFDPSLASLDLQLIHEARPLPPSGLLQLYRVSDNHRPVYALALVRHDIACGTCRDLLAAVYLTASTRQIAGVASLEAWEKESGSFDPDTFLAQLKGTSLGDSLRVGRDLDGISGATLTVGAMLTELRGLRSWFASRRATESKGNG